MYQQYGAVELPRKMTKDWEARGTILGLALDVACIYGYPFILVVPLLVGVSGFRGQLGECTASCGSVNCLPTTVWICEYTKAYVLNFPALGSILIVLLVGRDFLQKRLYYGCLKAGCALRFGKNTVWRDPLMICLFISFAHCLAFICLSTPILFQLNELRRTAGDESFAAFKVAIRSLMIAFATFIPITMVTVLLYSAYDLQSTLIPLSEYLQDIDGLGTGASTLEVVNDCTLKDLLKEEANKIQAASLNDGYLALINAYREKRIDQQLTPDGSQIETPIGLLKSFWPARLLMNGVFKDDIAVNFQVFWKLLTIGCLAWLIYVAFYLFHYVLEQGRYVMAGRYEQTTVVAVIMCHVVALVGAFTSFCLSFRTLLCHAGREQAQYT